MSGCQIRNGDIVGLNVVNLVITVEGKEQVDQSFSRAVVLQFKDQSKDGTQPMHLSRQFQRLGRISRDGIEAGGHRLHVGSRCQQLEAVHVLLEGAIHACSCSRKDANKKEKTTF